MKHLTLLLLLSTSQAFSQVPDSTIPIRQYNWSAAKPTSEPFLYKRPDFRIDTVSKPDTIRAICLITLGYVQQGIAHARMGFVVIQPGKPVVYLDCRKKALKWPQVGWDWREVDVNYKTK